MWKQVAIKGIFANERHYVNKVTYTVRSCSENGDGSYQIHTSSECGGDLLLWQQ